MTTDIFLTDLRQFKLTFFVRVRVTQMLKFLVELFIDAYISKREAPWSSRLSGSVMVQKVTVKREFEAGLRNATTGKLSLSAQQ